jgi:hypothetical protein
MDLRKVPGCHVYGGPTPLAAGIAKIPKERNLIFNIDSETEDALKEVPSFKVPFDKERPLPLECFDTIVKALADESDKTQCVFGSKDEIPATLGKMTSVTMLDKSGYLSKYHSIAKFQKRSINSLQRSCLS